MGMGRKGLSVLLIVAMVLSLFSLPVFSGNADVDAASKKVKAKVYYKANGGTFTAKKHAAKKTVLKKVTKGKKRGTAPKITRKGYALVGWYTKKSGGKKTSTATKIKKEKTVLYARWIKKYSHNTTFEKFVGKTRPLSEHLKALSGDPPLGEISLISGKKGRMFFGALIDKEGRRLDFYGYLRDLTLYDKAENKIDPNNYETIDFSEIGYYSYENTLPLTIGSMEIFAKDIVYNFKSIDYKTFARKVDAKGVGTYTPKFAVNYNVYFHRGDVWFFLFTRGDSKTLTRIVRPYSPVILALDGQDMDDLQRKLGLMGTYQTKSTSLRSIYQIEEQ